MNDTRISILESEIIAQNEERYLSFPEVVLTPSGSLLGIYRDADIHYPADSPTTELVLVESDDKGKSWKNKRAFPVYPEHRPQEEFAWHCARLSRMSDGRIAFLCDITQPEKFLPEIFISFSSDEGQSWTPPQDTGARGIMPDRLLQLSESEWIFAYHWRDQDVDSLAEFLYATEDAGKSWELRSKVGSDSRYDLCEASLIQLPDGRLVSYMRENSFMHIPTMVSFSDDRGRSWSEAVAHPTCGHRPCAGVLANGEILLTYRNVGGEPGLTAWRGSADDTFFAVSGKDLSGEGLTMTKDGIRISSQGGDWDAVEYTFPPLMSWKDSLDISVRVKRISGDEGACVIRAGGVLIIDESEIRYLQRHVVREEEKEPKLEKKLLGSHTLDTSEFHTYTVSLSAEKCRVLVDGKEVFQSSFAPDPYFRDRIVSFGSLSQDPANLVCFRDQKGEFLCSEISYQLKREDGEVFEFDWKSASKTFPNDYELSNCVQIDKETCGDWAEAGYSAWVPLGDGRVFCIDYRRGDADNPYIIGHQLLLPGCE